MVENPDRAEILSLLREFYNQLVDKVPVEVTSLHDEVLGQRALDKKLTIELMRFKTTIGVLTGELSEIRQHDQRISQQAQDTQKNVRADYLIESLFHKRDVDRYVMVSYDFL